MKKRFVLYLVIVTAAIVLTFLPVPRKKTAIVQEGFTMNEVKNEGGTEYEIQ